MYYNYYRDNEPIDEFDEINQRDEIQEIEDYPEYNVLPEYEDISFVEDSFRSEDNSEFEDYFVEFTPPFSCPFYRQQFPGGNFTPPRPPFGPPSGPSGNQGGAPLGGPGGSQGAIPSGPPPSFTPSKAQASHSMHGGPGLKAVDPGALRPCRFRFSYIWLTNGNAFWAYLTYIGRTSVSGYRWNGRRWVYFGIDLRRIDSFTCF